MITNAELIEALAGFWPEDEDEGLRFLAALRKAADAAIDNTEAGLAFAYLMCSVEELLSGSQQPGGSLRAEDRLLSAAAQGGLTIAAAAGTLGVSRWAARRHLDRLRFQGALRLAGKGRGSRWLLTERDAA